jgi:Tim17/Tim22/Tim23/Pmp24 family
MNTASGGDDNDAGAPIPDFRGASNIQLGTVAPAFGVTIPQLTRQPEYLDYEQKRSVVVRMFSNAGLAYCMGIVSGGLYGLQQGLQNSPTTNRRVQFNSVLNHCGRYGSKLGNSVGCFAIFYTLYEGAADHVRFLIKCIETLNTADDIGLSCTDFSDIVHFLLLSCTGDCWGIHFYISVIQYAALLMKQSPSTAF